MRRPFRIVPTYILLLLLLGWLLAGCAPDQTQNQVSKISGDLSGVELAEIYCGDCHLQPDPALLTKETWEKVLPQMRHFMGLRFPNENPFKGKGLQEGMYLETNNIFPTESTITDANWQKIESYYLNLAPDSLTLARQSKLPLNSLFSAKLIRPDLGGFPAVCMLDYDEVNHRVYVGDINGFIAELDSDFEVKNFSQLINPIVKCLRRHDTNELLLLDIGILDPKDMPAGAIVMTDLMSFSKRALVFEELMRPVDFASADLDQDGQEDLVVCAFGHLVGNLSWYRNNGQGYDRIILNETPGAIKVKTLDIEQDGDIDLMVLFAHGDEGIHLFRNDGRGKFQVDTLLRFHPLFGSADFQLIDINGDDQLDIILANGDNSDQSQILKPYHGVRIFINDGDLTFQEKYFYPMFGAYKVAANDFDQDGDYDLFAISFHPDFQQGLDQSLVYLENKGNFEFEPSGFDTAGEGRWMVMDSGDIDQDGDEDILVGSFALGPGVVPQPVLKQWRTSKDHMLYLENQLK